MSNPAVMKLTSTRVCGRELKIEDNLGEAIHIHLGEIRVDLTVEEFKNLSDKAENVLDQMDSLIPSSKISWRDLNPIFLQNPKNTDILFRLNNVYITKIKLKDILVDSYIKLPFVGKLPVYRSVRYSRIVKALNGIRKDNDDYIQLNELFMSNNERITDNLESIKKNGYPFNKNYIILNKQNMIIDGQHRAACLYHLHGSEYEIPVMKWEFDDPVYVYFPPKRGVLEVAFRAYASLVHREFLRLLKVPLTIIRIVKGKKFGKKGEPIKASIQKDTLPNDAVSTLQELINILVNKNIDFIVLDNEFAQNDNKVTLSLLVDKASQLCLKKCMEENGFFGKFAFSTDVEYLYSLERDLIYSNGIINIHVFYQLFCKSMFVNAMVPLEQFINQEAWGTKQYNEHLKCFQVGLSVSIILSIVQSVFFEKRFSSECKVKIIQNLSLLESDLGKKLLYNIFYHFTDRLLVLFREQEFDTIIEEYTSFEDY